MLIKDGIAADPLRGLQRKRDIRIEGDLIAELGETLEALPGEQVLEAAGCTVAPGLVDTHVHFRDPGFTWKEDLHTGALAAAAGGFTTVVCMANTNPVVDTPRILAEIQQRAAREDIRILQSSAITCGLKGRELADLEAMARQGAPLFTDDGIPLMDEAVLKEAMERAAALGIPISLHEEDPLLILSQGINQGEISRQMGLGGASAAAEEIMAARDLILAGYTGARICIQHVSSAGTVALLRCMKAVGADVHAEATPHHFTLTQEAVAEYGTNARMNPPLRTEADRQAIIEGLKDGTIDMIVTDHAPHAPQEKAKPFGEAPSGILGLETSLGLGIRSLVESGHLTLLQLLGKMSVNPAAFLHLPAPGLAPGMPADLVIFDEKRRWKVERLHSKSCNSPFLGWELPGQIQYTLCGGKIVYRR